MINTFYFHLSTFNFHIMLYERTLGQWLEHLAETTPDKEYIVYSDRNLRFTWSQFNRRVDDMAKGLIAIGVERGTHVGIWAANVPDWLTLLYLGNGAEAGTAAGLSNAGLCRFSRNRRSDTTN